MYKPNVYQSIAVFEIIKLPSAYVTDKSVELHFIVVLSELMYIEYILLPITIKSVVLFPVSAPIGIVN